MNYKPTEMLTYSGKVIDLARIDQPDQIDKITIVDVAAALSKIPRFGGHFPWRWSVADHCLHGAQMILDGTTESLLGEWVEPAVRDDVAMTFLLHDAGEAFSGDVSRPMRWTVPSVDEFCRRCQAAAEAALGVHPGGVGTILRRVVERIDHFLCAVELEAFSKNTRDRDEGLVPYPPAITRASLSPIEVSGEFVAMYGRLLTAIGGDGRE